MDPEKFPEDDIISPRSSANWISKLFLWWTIPLFGKAADGPIILEDMFPITKECTSKELGDPLMQGWEKTVKNNKPSFRSAITRTFCGPIIGLGFMFFLKECVLQVGVSLVFAQFLRVYSTDARVGSFPIVYIFASLYIVISAMYAFMSSHFTLLSMDLGCKMATSITEVIYRKTLKCSVTSLNTIGSGKLTNLIASDTKRFETGIGILHSLWAGPLLIIVVLTILWINYGPESFGGLIAVFVLTGFSGILGKVFSVLRTNIAKLTDSRLKLIEELVSGIRLIKIYTWERLTLDSVYAVRRQELSALTKRNWLMGFALNVQTLFSRVTILVTLVSYLLLGSKINVEKVFVVMSFYNMISGIMSGSFPSALLQLVEVNVAFKRIQSLLLLPEKQEKDLGVYRSLDGSPGSISVTNYSGTWSLAENSPGVQMINLEAKSARPTFLLGPVGSGKSTLLAGILGNLELSGHGEIHITGTVAYVSQSPWAFDGTIRDNILLGRTYEADWYNQVLDMCALARDLKSFPLGDSFPVGDRGMKLSGGQRARLNLARAIYSRADVYLLDDILSSLDSNVGREIFEKVVRGYLKYKCVIMVTHLCQFLQNDNIVLIKNGEIEAQGTQNELEGLGYKEHLHTVDSGKGSTTPEKNSDDEGAQVEHGRFNKSVRVISKAKHECVGADDNSGMPLLQKSKNSESYQEEQVDGAIGLKLCWKFLRSGNGLCTIIFGTISLIISQAIVSISDIWIHIWSNAEESRTPSTSTSGNYCEIYGMLIIMSFLVGGTINIFYFTLGLSSGRKLHKGAIDSLIRAPMQFFEQNSAGTVLNRFSKDTSNVDEYLPMTLFGALNCGLQVLGVLVVACVLNPTLIPPALVLIWIFTRLRKFYLGASSKIKRLEAIARSPVFTLFNATVDGIITIQALKEEVFFLTRFRKLKDAHSSAFFTYIATYVWFTLTLSLLIVVFQLFVVFTFILLVSNKAGAALVMTTVFSMTELFSATVQRTADLENDLVSVERLLEYQNLKPEGGLSTSTWKKKRGNILVENVDVTYGSNAVPILNGISFSVTPGERIGIVGRTGAGKSTLLWSLLRLVEPSRGSILIDGVDIRNLSLQELRSNISVIPQTPGFLRGTLRMNIDPFDKHSDSDIWAALESLQLAPKVKALPETILHEIGDGGNVFSQGEQQLISVARVLLQRNSILIMDEASASIDVRTEEIMQKAINEHYQSSTILMIAHRNETLLDCDRICLLEDGRIIEFGTPAKVFEKQRQIQQK